VSMTVDDLMAVQPVIPVLTVERLEDAEPLARALVAGGLRVLELTLRTEAAFEAIRVMGSVKGAIVGAGTALSAEDVDTAVAAGAEFIVTPGLTEATVAAARKSHVPILPGVATAGDIMRGLELELDRFKFFPAEQAGGVGMLKAFAGPFGKVRFCPTGGLSPANAPSYLALANVGVVGGGWLAPKTLVDAKDWDAITELSRTAAALSRRA
jgi:2-dehydro-3-deoxyphosphogluconate aldolase / (4S)-4-hydroxy-2-oxoglutarate aldolase